MSVKGIPIKRVRGKLTDIMGYGAVLILGAEAEDLPNFQVGTRIIDFVRVDSRQLVAVARVRINYITIRNNYLRRNI